MAESSNKKFDKMKVINALSGIKEWITGSTSKSYIGLYLIWPFILNIILESLGRKSFFGGIVHLFQSPYVFLVNMFIIVLTLSVTFLLKRRLFWVCLISVVWLIFGICNFVLLSNRVTPFTAVDLKLIDSAFAVMNKYLNNAQLVLAIFAIILAVVLLIFLYLKAPQYPKKISFLRSCGMIFVVSAVTFGSIHIGLLTGQVEAKFGELSKSYLKNGFVYCFSNSVVNTGVKKPSNYSQETIDTITGSKDNNKDNNIQGGLPDDLTNPDEISTPNIVIVQLESFFDVNEVTNMTFSENPIPNFTKYMQECDSGYFGVPVIGAGTSNVEFELLTGMNLDHFGPGEYPFNTILKTSTCESLAWNLLENGWATHGIHNNTGGFYSRNDIYARLGIQTYTSVEYMQVEEYTPMGWAKDFYIKDEIFKCLNDTEGQDFVYAISVQGHGSYPADAEYEKVIEVDEIWNEDLREQMNYYVNQIHEMDAFVGELVEAISEFEEDTILVMYGDHLPSLGFVDEQMKNGTVYETAYFIWNNMGLDFGDEDLEAYQMSAKLLKMLGIETGVINKYHQTYKGTEEYENGLQNLEYDILYGDLLCYGGVNPYEKLEIQMGIDPIEISNIKKAMVVPDNIEDLPLEDEKDTPPEGVDEEEPIEDDDATFDEEANPVEEGKGETAEKEGYVIIKGKNFTKYSKVYVNGEKYHTTFIDSSTLKIYYPDLKTLDSFVVWQSKLSRTKECLYYGE